MMHMLIIIIVSKELFPYESMGKLIVIDDHQPAVDKLQLLYALECITTDTLK